MSRFDSTKSEQLNMAADSPNTAAASGSSGSKAMLNSSSSSGLSGASSPDFGEPSSSSSAEDKAPLTAEETHAVLSAQPTGDVPSAEEMEDRKDAQSSADNLLPTDKLENGLKHARMLFATGWAGLAASVRDIENTETVGKIKEGTATMLDRSLDGLSMVGSKVAEVTDKGVQVVGAKLDEAAPAIGRWRDEVVIASERGFAAAKDMTDKAIAEIKKPGGSNGGPADSWEGGEGGAVGGAGGSAGASGDGSGGSEDGPHTV